MWDSVSFVHDILISPVIYNISIFALEIKQCFH